MASHIRIWLKLLTLLILLTIKLYITTSTSHIPSLLISSLIVTFLAYRTPTGGHNIIIYLPPIELTATFMVARPGLFQSCFFPRGSLVGLIPSLKELDKPKAWQRRPPQGFPCPPRSLSSDRRSIDQLFPLLSKLLLVLFNGQESPSSNPACPPVQQLSPGWPPVVTRFRRGHTKTLNVSRIELVELAVFRRNPQHRPEQSPAFFAESHFTPLTTPAVTLIGWSSCCSSRCYGVDRVLIDFNLSSTVRSIKNESGLLTSNLWTWS